MMSAILPLNVLILEDNPIDANLLADSLALSGFEFKYIHVDNKSKYAAQLSENLDLILADYLLPQFNALEALQLLHTRGLDIPFIIVTGAVSEETAVECIKEGASDYLLKDRLARLGQAVAKALDDKALRDEKRKVEKELNRLKEFSENIVQNMAEGIVVLDEDDNLIFANPAAAAMAGYTSEESVGLGLLVSKLHIPADQYALFNTVLEALKHGEVSRNEIDILSKDGSRRTLFISGNPQFEDRRFAGTLAVLTDITEDKHIREELAHARDAALEASHLKSTFLATMSHEIRTPMNGILGVIELLARTPLDASQQDMLNMMRFSGGTLLRIINDILDFSKIEAGKLTLETVEFELIEVVENVTDIMATLAHQKGISLSTFIDPAIPALIQGDSVRLHQILLNLVNNAVKFTHQGGVLLRATLESTTVSHVTVRFSVSDTGIGMSEEALRQLFQPFVQADASMSRKYGGTGLGLAICKRLVELMGQEIHVESRPGEGSTFWFSIPLARAISTPPPFEAVIPDGVRDLNILVVDDSPTNIEIVTTYLSFWGIQNTGVSSGEEALSALHQAVVEGHAYDLAITDFMMPQMDGFNLAKAIKQDVTLAATRMMLLTAAHSTEQESRALEAGFAVYLSKPVRQFDLLNAISAATGNSINKSVAAEVRIAESQDATKQMWHTSLPILLVEDNEINQNVVSLQLQALGYPSEVARTGQQALDVVAIKDYALILMDCQMPDMDGLETTRRIRQAEIALQRHIPIIALTGNAMPGDREACLTAGMDDYVTKPLDLEQLEHLLGHWVSPVRNVELPTVVAELSRGKASASETLDLKTLDKLARMLGASRPNMLRELIDNFLNDAVNLLDALRSGIKDGDAKAIRVAAHTLKSNSATYGGMNLSNLCKQLELAAHIGELNESAELMSRIENEFAKLMTALETERDRIPNE